MGSAKTLSCFSLFFVVVSGFLHFLVDGWCVIKGEVLCGVRFSDGVLLVEPVSPFVLDPRYRKQNLRKPGYVVDKPVRRDSVHDPLLRPLQRRLLKLSEAVSPA